MPPRHGRAAKGPGDHEEELAELQRRFNALAETRRVAEQSPALLSKELVRLEEPRPKTKKAVAVQDNPQLAAEIRKLDEQIIDLRRRHDRIHNSNTLKRKELDGMADKLKDLLSSSLAAEESPQEKLIAMEEKLGTVGLRYEDEHRTKMTYEQMIRRLKQERLAFPAELKSLEATLAQKETEYEQLLLMSHDANRSKEVAKAELSKFETIVSEERKLREKELQQRRQMLHKKQQLAQELEKSEKERKAMLHEPTSRMGEESAKAQAEQTQKLIEAEQRKIAAYEAAFQQIKEATDVADVNEVIQKFLSQEETHQNLLAMTRESQARIDALRDAVSKEKEAVGKLQFSLGEVEEKEAQRRPARDASHPDRDGSAVAKQALEKARNRWKRLWQTQVNCKSAVQHIIDTLEPLRLEEELTSPLTDDNLLEHLSQIEKKMARIAAAFLEEQERHAELMENPEAAIAQEAARQPPGSPYSNARWHRANKNESESEEEFEEDIEEDVMDREALKKQSGTILDKGTKKTKKKKKRTVEAEDADDAGKKLPGGTSTAVQGGLA